MALALRRVDKGRCQVYSYILDSTADHWIEDVTDVRSVRLIDFATVVSTSVHLYDYSTVLYVPPSAAGAAVLICLPQSINQSSTIYDSRKVNVNERS